MVDPPGPAVELTADPAVVAREAGAWLARHPWTANLMATVLAGELAGEGNHPQQSWALVRDADGTVVGAAMNSAPRVAWLPPIGAAAGGAVASAWHAAGRRPREVTGDAEATRAFAQRWAELTGGRSAPGRREGVLVLEELAPPTGVAGRVRPHRHADAELLLRWWQAFADEVHPDGPIGVDPDAVRARHAAGRLVVWEVVGEPVSFAGWRSGGGVGRIGPVYTPPEHRGHGYAAAVTTAASRVLLDAGERVLLHTDLENPTSNGVYERLGFRRVAELTSWHLLE
jgi:ribosomal protein S18 acetylase RimI-like enzyme